MASNNNNNGITNENLIPQVCVIKTQRNKNNNEWNDLERPLLVGKEEQLHVVPFTIDNSDTESKISKLLEEEEEDGTTTTNNNAYISNKTDHYNNNLLHLFRFIGIIIGFLIQFINILGKGYFHVRWGSTNNNNDKTISELFLYILFLFITHMDLLLNILLWNCLILFALTETKYIQSKLQQYFILLVSKRQIFILFVNFYAGTVIGIFLAWTIVSLVLNIQISFLLLFILLIIGLSLSYAMIWCYDDENE